MFGGSGQTEGGRGGRDLGGSKAQIVEELDY